MEYFLDQLLLVLPAVRVDLFNKQTRSREITKEKESELPSFELFLKKEKINATAVLNNGEFVVQAGSLARKEWIGDRTKKTSYWQLHDKLVEKGILVLEGSHRKFSESYAFPSTSAAGAVVNGRSTAGPIAWKVIGTKQTYKEWETQRLED